MYFAVQSSTCTTDEHHQVSYLDQDWGGGGGGGGELRCMPLHVEPFAGLAGLSTIAQLALALRFMYMW